MNYYLRPKLDVAGSCTKSFLLISPKPFKIILRSPSPSVRRAGPSPSAPRTELVLAVAGRAHEGARPCRLAAAREMPWPHVVGKDYL